MEILRLLLRDKFLFLVCETKCNNGELGMGGNWSEEDWGSSGLHKLWFPIIRDTSTWSKFGAHGEHGDVFLFSNLGVL